MKRFALVVLCLAAIFAVAGCNKKSESGKCTWSNTKSKFPSKQAFREYIKDSFVCSEHNVSIAQDEKYNPGCEATWKVLHAVDRMLADDWCERDIRRVVDMMRQGRRMMETLENRKACTLPNGRIRLDFYIMSLCPYGVQYASQVLPELIRETGDTVDWTPHYMVNVTKDGKFDSMHGPAEVQEDKAQLCILRNWGRRKWLDYMTCFPKAVQKAGVQGDSAVVAANKACLTEIKIDPAQHKLCMDTQADGYMTQEFKASQGGDVAGSPTAIYNCNRRIVGAVPFQAIKPYICELYPAKQMPEACRL